MMTKTDGIVVVLISFFVIALISGIGITLLFAYHIADFVPLLMAVSLGLSFWFAVFVCFRCCVLLQDEE